MNQPAPTFCPPPFRPHPLLFTGHLQTVATLRPQRSIALNPTEHRIELDDGDQIVLHEDRPDIRMAKMGPLQDDAILLVHGLCGCHSASYMVRLAKRLTELGFRVFRMDMRGCGTGAELARNITHAGRSDDVMVALDWIANQCQGSLGVAGFSLGGNQVLLGLSLIGAGKTQEPDWFRRLTKAAAVSPPINLSLCSQNMKRWGRRFYSRYFIRHLLRRIPTPVAERSATQELLKNPPKSLWDLDDRLTAPLSGFNGAEDYYHKSSSKDHIESNPIQTLILSTADDPIVPVGSFIGDRAPKYHAKTELMIQPRGGHLGFVDHKRECWMDQLVSAWFKL